MRPPVRPADVKRQEPMGGLPVSLKELAELLEAETSDPLLLPLLESAVEEAARFTRRELRRREVVYVYDLEEPRPGASHRWQSVSWFELQVPGLPLVSVDKLLVRTGSDLTLEEVDTDSYRVLHGDEREARIVPEYGYPGFGVLPVVAEDAFRVEATVGYASNELPPSIKLGVLLLAAYLYEHRGCDSGQALKKSGADGRLRPYRMPRL